MQVWHWFALQVLAHCPLLQVWQLAVLQATQIAPLAPQFSVVGGLMHGPVAVSQQPVGQLALLQTHCPCPLHAVPAGQVLTHCPWPLQVWQFAALQVETQAPLCGLQVRHCWPLHGACRQVAPQTLALAQQLLPTQVCPAGHWPLQHWVLGMQEPLQHCCPFGQVSGFPLVQQRSLAMQMLPHGLKPLLQTHCPCPLHVELDGQVLTHWPWPLQVWHWAALHAETHCPWPLQVWHWAVLHVERHCPLLQLWH